VVMDIAGAEVIGADNCIAVCWKLYIVKIPADILLCKLIL